MKNLKRVGKDLKHLLKNRVRLTKDVVIMFLITGVLSMADTSIPEIKKYQPIIEGTVTATEGTSIGTGALTTSTNGLSVGRGNIASGGGMSAVELKRLLEENESIKNEINEINSNIVDSKKEILEKENEILKLEIEKRDIIADKDRVKGARERVEELNKELEKKKSEKSVKEEELTILGVTYAEEIKKLNHKKDLIRNLAINWTSEDLSSNGSWVDRVDDWARELERQVDPDGTLRTKIAAEGATTADDFYRNYVTDYIKAYVALPDLENLLANGDTSKDEANRWNIENNALLKASGIKDGTLTKENIAVLSGGVVNGLGGDKKNEKYGVTFKNFLINPSTATLFNKRGIYRITNTSYNIFNIKTSDEIPIFIKPESIQAYIEEKMLVTNEVFSGNHKITKENILNFYEDYKEDRKEEYNEYLKLLDKAKETGILKEEEYEYRKFYVERNFEISAIVNTLKAFNTVINSLDKTTNEAVRLTNEKRKILESYRDKLMSKENSDKELELYTKLAKFSNFEKYNFEDSRMVLLHFSGLKWYNENVIDVRNRNDKNTKKFLDAFSAEIERLKGLEREKKTEISRVETEINEFESEIAKIRPNETDEELERKANEKLEEYNNAKEELDRKKEEIKAKEEELKEKIETLRANLNVNGGNETIAQGINNIVSGDKGIALGNSNAVSGENSIATGINNTITGRNSIAYGAGHNITGDNSGAFGDPITIHGDGSYGFGNNITIGTQGDKQVGKDTFVLGSEVTTTVNNAVILGKGSTGVADAVSVGTQDATRNIKFVKEGEISATSKDAINGSQLFAIAKGTSTDIDVDGWKNKLGINNLNGGISNITIKVGEAEKSITDGNKIEFIDGSGTTAAIEGEDNTPKVKYSVNVDDDTIEVNGENKLAIRDGSISKDKLNEELKGKINAIDNKLNKDLSNFDDSNVNAEGKTKLITALNKDVNLTTPTGALVKDSDIKPELDKKLNSADVTKDYLTNVLGKGSVTSNDFTINNGTDRLVGTGDLTISLKANSISEDKLDKDLRDKLARIGEVNPGAIPELTKGSLTGEEFTITGEGKLVDGDLTIALKEGSITKNKLNEELKNKIDAIDTKADKTEVDKKLNKDLSNFNDADVNTEGKTKLITALNKNFSLENPTGAVATDRELKTLSDGKASKDLSNLTEVAEPSKIVLINALSNGSSLETPGNKLVTDTTVKAALDNKANTDLNNIVAIGENGKSKLKEALGGADLNAPKDAFVTDTILKPVLEDKLNKDADNLSDIAVTNLINKLSENANLTAPTGKFVTDTIIKPALDLKLDKSDLVKANLVGNGITVEGTGKVLDSDLTLSIANGAISKDKLAEDVKNEINAKANKDFVMTELATVAGNLALKASVDASNIDGENLTKWKEKLGITVDGNIIATPNAISYTDETHTTINLGKDNQLVTIKNVSTPVELTDAANKEYVDSKMNEAQNGIKSYVNNSVAMAQIPQVSGNKYFAFGAGAAYNGGNVGSFAFGISGQDKSKRFVYKASAGISTDKKWNVGAGFSVSLGEISQNSEKENQVIPTDALAAENKELKAKVNANEKQLEELKAVVQSLLNSNNKHNDNQPLNKEQKNVKKYTLNGYKIGAYKLTETQIKELNELLKDVDKVRNIEVIGYTDTRGEDKANLSLGYNRALSVKQYFESLGYTNISISSSGFNLIIQDLKGDQELNRRVEIIIE